MPVYPRHKPEKEKIEAENDESIENKIRIEMLKWIEENENGYEFYKKSPQYDPEFVPAYHVSTSCMLQYAWYSMLPKIFWTAHFDS